MIEPIVLSNPEQWKILIKENERNNLFFTNTLKTVISLVYIKKYDYPLSDLSNLWRIEICQDGILRRQTKEFYIKRINSLKDKSTKEEFISHLSKNYPEHMEWFLFNKEWLD